MFKFENYEDYKAQRDAAINEAESLLKEGKNDEYQAKVKYVEDMDAAYEDYTKQQANIAALRGAAHVTMSTGIANMVQDDEKNYRIQFMNHVLKGAQIKMNNSDQYTTTSDVGAVIPNTILNRIIEKMENVGGIYAKMTKTFYRGGVTVPTSAAKPTATWTTERGTTDKQNKAIGSITFTYHKLRCVVSVSVAVATVTLEVFEQTLANNIADAMVKAIEKAAFVGTGTNEPKGILKETVPAGQTIDITEGQSPTYENLLAAEGALPEAYEGAEWYMRRNTFFTKYLGMTDTEGQPIARVNIGLAGKPEYSLLGRKVNFTEHVPAFATSVSDGTPFAVMFDFGDYMINTNLAITVKEYTDEDTDDQVKKAIMLADGKAIDISSLVVMQVKNS